MYIGHYESLELPSTEVMGKGGSGVMRKNREKKETTTKASSLSIVDLEKSERSIKNNTFSFYILRM